VGRTDWKTAERQVALEAASPRARGNRARGRSGVRVHAPPCAGSSRNEEPAPPGAQCQRRSADREL